MKLISTKEFLKYKVQGEENIQEDVSGILFDIKNWDLKFLIIERGFWIFKKEYLLSVKRIKKMIKESKTILVDLTKSELEKLPQIANRKGHYQEVTSEYSLTLSPVHRFSKVWNWRTSKASVTAVGMNRINVTKNADEEKTILPELRSSKEMSGFKVHAKGGKIGKIRDLIFDGENWSIRYLIVGGDENKIMLPPQWIDQINPVQEMVKLNLTRDVVLNSPYVIG